MANYDEFDAESQALLNNLQQNNKFLSFEDLNKGFVSQSGYNPALSTINKLASHQWKYLKRTSTEIQEIFFGFITPFKINNLTLIQEPNCECNIDPKEFLVYKESGENKGFQKEEDELLFKVKIYISKRGEVIQQAKHECKAADNEVLLFIEDNTGDSSNAKMFAKFGNESQKAILLGLDGDTKLKSFLNSLPGFSKEVLQELVTKGEYESKSSIIKLIAVGLFKFVSVLTYPAKVVGWVAKKIGNGIIEHLSIPDKVWDSRSEEYFLNRENMIKSLQIDSSILKTIEASLNDDPIKFELIDLIPEFVIKYIKQGVEVVEYLINTFNKLVTNEVNKLYDEYEETIAKADFYLQLSENIAYICGIWNGLVDFIGGLLIFVGEILKVQNNIGKDFENFLEHYDSFIDAIREFDKVEFWNGVKKQYVEIKKYLLNLKITDINFDKVAYFAGFGVAFIATMFIPFTAFAKPLNVLNKLKNTFPAGLVEKISQATVKTADFVVNASQKSANAFLAMFRKIITLLNKGAKAVAKFVNDLWKKIADWFVENRKVIEKIGEKSNKLINNFIRKLPKSIANFVNTLPNSIQKKILNGLLVLEFNGKTLCKISPKGIITELKLYAEYDAYEIISSLEKVKVLVKIQKNNKLIEKVYIESIEVIKNYRGEPVFRAKFIEGIKRDAELVNEIFIRNQGTPPYKTGNKVIDKFLNPGEKFYIVENINQPIFGSWASTYKVKNIKEFRDFLAVATRFKNGELIIKEYEVLKTIKVREDGIGEVYDEILNKWLKGGKQQYELLEPMNKELSNGEKLWQELLKEIDSKPLN